MLTREQKRKIACLQQAAWKVEEARKLVQEALGDSDVTQEYTTEFNILLGALVADMDDVAPVTTR